MSSAGTARQPVFSMTGFARVTGHASDAVSWTLTLKSVNHRFLDLHMRMPGGTEALEVQLRRLLKDQLVRGHIEVTLSFERTGKRGTQYDAALLAAYVAAFRAAAAEHGLAQEPDLNAIFALPEVLGGPGAAHSGDARAAEMKELEAAVLAQAPAAVAQLQEMRVQEGAALAAELRAAMARMEAHVAEVDRLHAEVEQAHYTRLRERLTALLGEAPGGDRERMLQEAALLVERSDVTEEIARLRAHVGQFQALVTAGGELGKKLDFLLQEMNREANTLLSKMSGVAGDGTKVTELGLRMKSDVEKAREQVQNIE